MRRAILVVAGLGLLTSGVGQVQAGSVPGPRPPSRVRIHAFGGVRLGVSLRDVAPGEPAGAAVAAVNRDSAAERAGLREGDVLVRFDSEPVRSALQLARLVRETPAGRKIGLVVRRGGQTVDLSCELDSVEPRDLADLDRNFDFDFEFPDMEELHELRAPGMKGLAPGFAKPPAQARLGLSFQEIGGQLAQFFKLEGERGVLVTEVEADGPAGRGGLKAGDVILTLAGDRIEDARDLRSAVAAVKRGEATSIEVWREGRKLQLDLPAREPRTSREPRPTDRPV